MYTKKKRILIIGLLLASLLVNYFFYNLRITPISPNNREGVEIKPSATASLLWNYTAGGGVPNSPALADIDNDGKLEVIIGCADSHVYVLNSEDGTLVWKMNIGGSIWVAPSIADIDNDGKLEIVVGSFSNHNMYALNSEDGSQLWWFPTGDAISSDPSLADLDGDNKLEVVFGGQDDKVYVLNGEDGSLLWNYTTGDDITTSPAVGDLNNDGKLEVAIGSRDHKIYVFHGENGTILWSYESDYWIPNSPSIGDFDLDGDLDVVISFTYGTLVKAYSFEGHNGSVHWTYEKDFLGSADTALADIDGDGYLEIVFGDRVVLNAESGSIYYERILQFASGTTAVLGDIDGDGKLEAVCPNHSASYEMRAISFDTNTTEWIFYGGYYMLAVPVLEDIDNDGKLEAIIPVYNSNIYAVDITPSGSEIAWQGDSGDNAFHRWRNKEYVPLEIDLVPECIIELQKDGIEISEIFVKKPFDIYVGDSYDDHGIAKVRFSSDETADDILDGNWTDWYYWGASFDDWNAISKIKEWSFSTTGTKEIWVEIQDDSGQNNTNNAIIHCKYPKIEGFLSKTKVFSAFGHSITLNLSLFASTPHNIEVLNEWNVVPDEGYSLIFGFMLEIHNLRRELESLSVPQFLLDFCDLIISDDDSIRILITLNVISAYDKSLDEFIKDVKKIVEPLLPILFNPNNKISVPAAARWFFDNPILEQWFHITRGTNQYELKLKGSAISNPIMAVLKVLDIFFRIDFQLLTYRAGDVIPVKIGSHDLIEAASFTIDIIKLATKVARIAGTIGADLLAWAQAFGTSYSLFHKFIFDPPLILKTILDAVFPGLHDRISEIFENFEKISDWIYVVASFLDPPSARLDLALFDNESDLILGYDSNTHTTIQNSTEGFVVGDENAQFMLIYNSSYEIYDLRVFNTDLDGMDGPPLNYSMTLKQIGFNETFHSSGYLIEGEYTSASIKTPNGTQQFSVNTLSCNLLTNIYPEVQILILDQNDNPIEIDSIQLYFKGEEIPFAFNYEGNGTYILSNFTNSFDEQETFQILLKKDNYLMNMISFNFSPQSSSDVPEIPGYNLYFLIFTLLGIAFIMIRKLKIAQSKYG